MRRQVWLWAVAAALAGTASAAAQRPHHTPPAANRSAVQEQNEDQPIHIDADTLEVRDKSKIATFSGNVQVVQGDTTLKSRTLVVFYGREIGLGGHKHPADAKRASGTPQSAQNIRRIEARGDVTVVSKDQNASGDLGVYDLKAKTITLSGNVVVSQGQNVIHGERVVVDTVTGNAHVEAAAGATQGRVRALIIPNKGQNGGPTNFLTIGPGPTK
jgi:lipopolysaccharide export system protein LptA